MVNLIGGVLLLTLTCLTGIVAYGKYYDCDLIGSKKIAKGEQVQAMFTNVVVLVLV